MRPNRTKRTASPSTAPCRMRSPRSTTEGTKTDCRPNGFQKMKRSMQTLFPIQHGQMLEEYVTKYYVPGLRSES